MFSAILFDLDGTLIDTESLWAAAVGRALEERDCLLTAPQLVELVYGRAWRDIFADIRQRYPEAYDDYAVMTAVAQGHFHALRQTRDIRIPGSIEVLIRLAAAYPVAIVSGSARRDIARELDALALTAHVRFFLGCEDYTPGKPHPACYQLAAERLAVPPANCLVFEDSTHGVRAAKAAGMTCVALRRPEQPAQDYRDADFLVGDLRECLRDGILWLEGIASREGEAPTEP